MSPTREEGPDHVGADRSGQRADGLREELLERWDRAAAGWGASADRVREFGMPVSEWMIDQLALQPGQRVLELAAGPGDTGFLAAELLEPGGTLICSDASSEMLDVARARAAAAGVRNVEFLQLQLEWIDLPTASVDGVLCRWGYMLIVDPAAALQETRRVLAPSGRLALGVWDGPEHNPWATIPGRALVELGHAQAPDPAGPGMFALAAPGRLQTRLEQAGFTEVMVDAVDVQRSHPSVDHFISETHDLSRAFADALRGLSDREHDAVRDSIAALAETYTGTDGSLVLPGRSLVAAATA